MHSIVNRTDFTLYLTKEAWKRSSGLLVNGDFNDPIVTTTPATSGGKSSYQMISSSIYLISLFYLSFYFIF